MGDDAIPDAVNRCPGWACRLVGNRRMIVLPEPDPGDISCIKTWRLLLVSHCSAATRRPRGACDPPRPVKVIPDAASRSAATASCHSAYPRLVQPASRYQSPYFRCRHALAISPPVCYWTDEAPAPQLWVPVP